MTNTEIIASCVIMRTLSGVILRNNETKNEEKAVTNETERPIVMATESLFVTPKAEQIPKTATKTWLLLHNCSVR